MPKHTNSKRREGFNSASLLQPDIAVLPEDRRLRAISDLKGSSEKSSSTDVSFAPADSQLL